MDINGWFTLITVLLAVGAILPKEELEVLKYKFHWGIFLLFGLILMVLIPGVIKYYSLAERFEFLKHFSYSGNPNYWKPFQKGLNPETVAIFITYGIFLLVIWYLWKGKPLSPMPKTKEYIKNTLKEKDSREFGKFIIKHVSKKTFIKNQNFYNELLLDRQFLKSILEYQPYFVLRIWEVFKNDENRFALLLKLLLEDVNSILYKELLEVDYRTDYEKGQYLPTLMEKIAEDWKGRRKLTSEITDRIKLLIDFQFRDLKPNPDIPLIELPEQTLDEWHLFKLISFIDILYKHLSISKEFSWEVEDKKVQNEKLDTISLVLITGYFANKRNIRYNELNAILMFIWILARIPAFTLAISIKQKEKENKMLLPLRIMDNYLKEVIDISASDKDKRLDVPHIIENCLVTPFNVIKDRELKDRIPLFEFIFSSLSTSVLTNIAEFLKSNNKDFRISPFKIGEFDNPNMDNHEFSMKIHNLVVKEISSRI